MAQAEGKQADKAAGGERPTFDSYPRWLEDKFHIVLAQERNRYERESEGIRQAAFESPLWTGYRALKASLGDRYLAETQYRLFINDDDEQILAKPWRSFLHKTYRLNVAHNRNWPDEPDGGWLAPHCWFGRVHDIARTSIIVKYLDGVNTVTKALAGLAECNGVADYACSYEARDTGYYAAHIRAGFQFGVMSTQWQREATDGQYEIQVTTQLQEVIRKLTHDEYELRRERAVEPTVKWQWDYQSPSFTPNYLGHILHYMEGMIMEVRTRGAAARDV